MIWELPRVDLLGDGSGAEVPALERNIRMSAAMVDLNDMRNAYRFVQIANRYPYDIFLVRGRYRVDGKSLRELFSLDLTKPIRVDVSTNNCSDLLADLGSIVVK